MKNNRDRLAILPAIDSFINFISITLTINARNNGINSTMASLCCFKIKIDNLKKS